MQDTLFLHKITVSPFETNSYIVADNHSQEALIIDPGGEESAIEEVLRENKFTVKAIVDTHGHADHIAANRHLKDLLGCQIMVHEFDAQYLTDPQKNLSAFVGFQEISGPAPDILLHDGDKITIGQLEFEVIHIPGHTPGGICLYTAGILFSGDTLFAGSVGRTDFPGGSHNQLIESIRKRLIELPDDTTVYPGHGPQTTIGRERETNPFI